MTADRHELPQFKGYHCIACGTENPHGLHMSFYREGKDLCSDLSLNRRYVGWENMAHGGVVSMVLDEVMAWAILYFRRSFCVTRKISTRFIKPVPVETPLTARARMLECRRRFACLVEGEIVNEKGTVLAKAEADFALLRDEQLGLLPKEVRKDMSKFVEQLGPLGIEELAAASHK